MKFRLEINLGNAAFDPNPADELARLLQHASGQVQFMFLESPKIDRSAYSLRDLNGNAVGTYRITGRK
jgi:hypothetical protein